MRVPRGVESAGGLGDGRAREGNFGGGALDVKSLAERPRMGSVREGVLGVREARRGLRHGPVLLPANFSRMVRRERVEGAGKRLSSSFQKYDGAGRS